MPLLQGLLSGKYQNLKSFPKNRARTRHFDSRHNQKSRTGENGFELETTNLLKKLNQISCNYNIPLNYIQIVAERQGNSHSPSALLKSLRFDRFPKYKPSKQLTCSITNWNPLAHSSNSQNTLYNRFANSLWWDLYWRGLLGGSQGKIW